MGGATANTGTKFGGIPVERPRALPGLDLPNTAVAKLKGVMCAPKDQHGFVAKTGAYLGYRLITFTGITTAANLISTVVSAIFVIITLPTRCCKKEINTYFVDRTKDSGKLFLKCLFGDTTLELRQLGRPCSKRFARVGSY